MLRRIMLVPAGENAGLTTVTLGLLRAFQQQAIDVNFFKPVAQTREGQSDADHSNEIVRKVTELSPAKPISQAYVERMISDNKMDDLLEEIISNYEQHYADSNAVIIEGLVADPRQPYTVRLNRLISNALNAKLVLVMNPGTRTDNEINDQLEIATDNYGGHSKQRLLGCIFNKINAPLDENGRIQLNLNLNDDNTSEEYEDSVPTYLATLPIFSKKFSFLGAVTWSAELNAPRILDLCRHVNAEVLNGFDELGRRISSVHFCARELYNMIPVLKPGALLVVSADRADVIVAASLAALNGTRLGALLLTGDYSPSARIMDLCQQALATGLPILKVNTNTWSTAIALQSFNEEVPVDDVARISAVMDHTASCIDENWVRSLTEGVQTAARLSPPAFRYKLTQLARNAHKRIVLPEGNEPRTIAAAAICEERGIAKCVLLGDKEEIQRIAETQKITLPESLEIMNPASIRERYVEQLVELRKHKGVTEVIAHEQLLDNNMLGTMMLKQGDVDGLVSGAVNTTASTIRPALQLIKTAPDASLVSSIFFMLLPDQVLVYGDCAINPDPDAEALAEIAIQSADSAKAFGIEPRVAMISYSTGDSGTGSGVDKVKAATHLTKQKRPDLIIDGPLQYDAAVMESVAKKKAPNSPVAGQATVLVFPDLNTGNTTYKAVQRSADLVSIGPMLQGLNKPVNDLSRGALVDDIVYTIALTAIQATQR